AARGGLLLAEDVEQGRRQGRLQRYRIEEAAPRRVRRFQSSRQRLVEQLYGAVASGGIEVEQERRAQIELLRGEHPDSAVEQAPLLHRLQGGLEVPARRRRLLAQPLQGPQGKAGRRA